MSSKTDQTDGSATISIVSQKFHSPLRLALSQPTQKGCRGVVLQRLPVPDPLAVGVVEPVRQPLRLQEVVALHAQEQRLATPVHKWLRISQVAKNKFREWLWLKRHTLVVGF